jgi:hypothetical protein
MRRWRKEKERRWNLDDERWIFKNLELGRESGSLHVIAPFSSISGFIFEK